jgi:hypothetical protein
MMFMAGECGGVRNRKASKVVIGVCWMQGRAKKRRPYSGAVSLPGSASRVACLQRVALFALT